jgi:hypothetical protein
MFQWMVYVLVVTFILTIAAHTGERALRLRQRMTRWVWTTAIAGSLAVPIIISSVSIQVPSITVPGAPGGEIILRNATSLPLSALSRAPLPPSISRVSPSLDVRLARYWLIASGTMLILLSLSALQLALRTRHWTRATVAGLPVYIAPDAGPAVIGLLHPRIVLPPWMLESGPSFQAAVMAHEQSHLTARDPLLLTIALCLLVFMPWNLPLWWQLRQLRRAIEVDCDARVLRAGHDVSRYGDTLIKVAARQSAFVGTVAAMSESRSFLEQRLRIMVSRPGRRWKTYAALLGCASVFLIAAAAQVTPPNADTHEGPTREAVAMDPAVYDPYVGYYRFDETAVMRVWRDGGRFFTRLTGQGPVEIFPSSPTEYFAKIVDARITFTIDAHGRGVALTVHQNGAHHTAPRVDDQIALHMEDAISAHVKSQAPYPGSEAALRRYYSALLAGRPDYGDMTPQVAEMTRQNLELIKSIAPQYGAIESVEFRGVGTQGWDVYDVHHERANATWRITMSSDGKIAGVFVQSGP